MNSVSKFVFALLMICPIVINPHSAFTAGIEFELINSTEFNITGLYISMVTSNSWEENILNGQVIATGRSTIIAFPDYYEECYWDMKAVDEYNNTYTFYGLNLCDIYELTILPTNADY